LRKPLAFCFVSPLCSTRRSPSSPPPTQPAPSTERVEEWQEGNNREATTHAKPLPAFPAPKRNLPVITSDGRLVGLLTRRDAEEALPQFGG
jgi:hypothetical protein